MVVTDKKIRGYALKNALAHEGKANSGAVISGLFAEGLKKEHIKDIIKDVSKIINEINKLSLEEQKKQFEKLENHIHERETREGLEELPNVKKSGVIMRFAPSPSGALHIGHAMTSSLSYLYVKKYGGKFYIRIEDTNPENIYKPAYKLIEKDVKWLFKDDKKIKIVIQSERMNLYYKYTEKLLKANSAYICTCNSEKFKKFADFKENCPCRNNDLKENLFRWKKMLDKTSEGLKEGEAVVRFKTPEDIGGMKHPNPAMRDFPLARINETSHPLQKKKYKVWPLMNLSVSVDDIEEKMTHIIRANEHRDNAKRQEMIFKVLGKEKQFPWTGFLGRFKFKDMELSASKITQGIKEGKYSGWDDERLPTLQALKKKYKPEAFWKFAERIGISENDKVIDKKEFFILLDSFNK